MRKKWTADEITNLTIFYPTSTNDDILLSHFPLRSLTSIKTKAKRLKLHKDDVIAHLNRSNAHQGQKNGMYGKTSKIKGKTYDIHYGIDKSNEIKKKLHDKSVNNVGLVGNKNGMYGKTPWNKGKKLTDEERKVISVGQKIYWESLTEDQLLKRKNQLRNDWIIKRNKYAEIDTVPEKIIESLLVNLNLNYSKKLTIGHYNCDFVVNDRVIEVHGDYWHANPKFYTNLDKIQTKNVARDDRKFKFLINMGYHLLILWENDIHNNIDICHKKILNFMVNNC